MMVLIYKLAINLIFTDRYLMRRGICITVNTGGKIPGLTTKTEGKRPGPTAKTEGKIPGPTEKTGGKKP